MAVLANQRSVHFAASRVGNPRYSRLGSLRYLGHARFDTCWIYHVPRPGFQAQQRSRAGVTVLPYSRSTPLFHTFSNSSGGGTASGRTMRNPSHRASV